VLAFGVSGIFGLAALMTHVILACYFDTFRAWGRGDHEAGAPINRSRETGFGIGDEGSEIVKDLRVADYRQDDHSRSPSAGNSPRLTSRPIERTIQRNDRFIVASTMSSNRPSPRTERNPEPTTALRGP
jgi:hypothetical protein